VWVHGRTNSGKSFLAGVLKEIFIGEDFPDNDSKYFGQRQRTEYSTQLVNMDEANFYRLFKPSNLAILKKFMEGKGYNVEVKF